ncbi:MAG: HdeD family acid-resistance protein [Rubrobacter sp.]|nr:HdeD family acid-resistance protein [Rubrobacter sp.]
MTRSTRRSQSTTLSGNWWALALRGAAAILFGLLTIFLPGLTLAVLVVLFGIYAVVDGVFAVAAGARSPRGKHRTLLLAEGVIGVFAGLLALLWPGLSAVLLLYIVAVWAILGGLLRITTAILLRREIDNEWTMISSGALLILLGVILGIVPGVGLLSLAWLIGVFALGAGVTLIWLAFRVRGRRAGGGERAT